MRLGGWWRCSCRAPRVTQFRENDLLIDVVLRTPRSEHRDVDALKSLPIGSFNGQSVTLGQIARSKPAFEDGVIWRRDRLPTISVRGDPVGKTQPAPSSTSIAPQVAAVQGAAAAGLPAGNRRAGGKQRQGQCGHRRIVAADRDHHADAC